MKISAHRPHKNNNQKIILRDKVNKLMQEELKNHPKSKIIFANTFGKRSTNLNDLIKLHDKKVL